MRTKVFDTDTDTDTDLLQFVGSHYSFLIFENRVNIIFYTNLS
jgi:hypothetical protein